MKLNCAILHQDAGLQDQLMKYIEKVPFLCCCGAYNNALEALKAYYEKKVEVYFIGIGTVKEGEIDGRDFCKLLDLYTRVIFIADTDRYAAECFRLDALDYLVGGPDFATFFQAVSKASRWFSARENGNLGEEKSAVSKVDVPKVIYIRADNRILRLELDCIDYIESCGDYVKVYYRDMSKPILSLCSMKYMEERLPVDRFIRVHRSYIVRMDSVSIVEDNSVIVGEKSLPIGASYRKRVKDYVSRLMFL